MTAQVLEFVELSDKDLKKTGRLGKLGKGDQVMVQIKRRGGNNQTLSLPPNAASLIEALLSHLSQGQRVAVLTEDQELSPNGAASILGISRPLVVHRMDVGDLPFRYVGKHRRAKLRDVLTLKTKIDAQRSAMRHLPTMPKTSNSTMAFDPSVDVFDACILYPFHLRNIIVQAPVDRLVEARWTDKIHDEWTRNLAADTPAIPIERLQTTRRLMNDALPQATVSGYENLAPTVRLPDPDDRHVVAAAIAAGASIILTWNLRDFPAKSLKNYGLRRQTPDAFFAGLCYEVPELVVGSLANARYNLNKSRVSASNFIDILRNQNLIPSLYDKNPCAQSRRPRVIIRQG